MEKKLLKSICSSIVFSAFFACSNEIPVEQEYSATKAEAQFEEVVIVKGKI
jgi:hypothetical protein